MKYVMLIALGVLAGCTVYPKEEYQLFVKYDYTFHFYENYPSQIACEIGGARVQAYFKLSERPVPETRCTRTLLYL